MSVLILHLTYSQRYIQVLITKLRHEGGINFTTSYQVVFVVLCCLLLLYYTPYTYIPYLVIICCCCCFSCCSTVSYYLLQQYEKRCFIPLLVLRRRRRLSAAAMMPTTGEGGHGVIVGGGGIQLNYRLPGIRYLVINTWYDRRGGLIFIWHALDLISRAKYDVGAPHPPDAF